MPIVFNGRIWSQSKQTAHYVSVAFRILAIVFLFHGWAFGADSSEALHQRILAGDQISLNPSAPEGARTIDAKWIKEAALKRVKIEIYHAVIQGPLDAQDVTFEQGFTLASCTIKDYADFSHATFKRDFFASDTAFGSWVSFRGAAFEHNATLQRARFEGPIAFDDAHFLESFDATEAYFAKDAGTVTFSQCRFDGIANFAFARFDAHAHFISAQFGGQGYFPGTRFGGRVEFERAHFFGIATFGSGPSNKRFNATFVGDAFFGEAQFDSTADFEGATFESEVQFFDTTFRSVAAFSGTTFKSLCAFSRAQFGGDGYFMGARFFGPAAFESAHIAGSLYFQAQEPLRAATFRGDARFTNAQVENIASFGGGNGFASGAVFGGKAIFNMAKFRGLSNFQGVEFKGDAEFVDATLGNDANFLGATFEGDAAFDRAQIIGVALFSPQAASNAPRSANFEHRVSFSSAHFGSEARFSKVRFDEEVDFVGTHFEGDAHFEDSMFAGPSSFRSAVFRAVYFSAAEAGGTRQFMGDVDLLGCTYDRIQVDWHSLLQYPNGQSRIQPYDRQPYIQLEAALRRSGSDEDADAVYAERRRVENQKLKGLARARDDLYWLLANYGIDLWRESIITALFLGIGMFVFARPGAVLTDSGMETEISWWQALFLAIRQFLPFGLPTNSLWTPSQRIVFKFVRPSAYANFLQIVGWILIPLAVASLAGFLRHGAQ
jgi:hypothetical protein